ncbi:hypothetical protein ABK040_009197 [Willaertia magna]
MLIIIIGTISCGTILMLLFPVLFYFLFNIHSIYAKEFQKIVSELNHLVEKEKNGYLERGLILEFKTEHITYGKNNKRTLCDLFILSIYGKKNADTSVTSTNRVNEITTNNGCNETVPVESIYYTNNDDRNETEVTNVI